MKAAVLCKANEPIPVVDAGASRVVVRPVAVKTEPEMAAELARIAEIVRR